MTDSLAGILNRITEAEWAEAFRTLPKRRAQRTAAMTTSNKLEEAVERARLAAKRADQFGTLFAQVLPADLRTILAALQGGGEGP
jgi:hypothetical protein